MKATARRTRLTNRWSRPVLRWAGSKTRLLPTLSALLPNMAEHRYVEPFAGSASLFFATKPARALLTDFNDELINAHQMIKKHPYLLHRAISAFGVDSESYYKIRDHDAIPSEPLGRAVRFIYLNRNCFNGLYRTNRKGEFNVPLGKSTGALPDSRTFYRNSIALRAADLRTADFETTIKSVGSGDFLYVDPPYSSSRPNFGEYGYGAFGDKDIERLASALIQADKAGAVILLSYAANEELVTCLEGWSVHTISVRRSVASKPSSRRFASEILASNTIDIPSVLQSTSRSKTP